MAHHHRQKDRQYQEKWRRQLVYIVKEKKLLQNVLPEFNGRDSFVVIIS